MTCPHCHRAMDQKMAEGRIWYSCRACDEFTCEDDLESSEIPVIEGDANG